MAFAAVELVCVLGVAVLESVFAVAGLELLGQSEAGGSQPQSNPEPKKTGSAILININKAKQKMTVFVDGTQKYDWPVSTGRAGYSTPSGTYTATSMNEIWYSKEWALAFPASAQTSSDSNTQSIGPAGAQVQSELTGGFRQCGSGQPGSRYVPSTAAMR